MWDLNYRDLHRNEQGSANYANAGLRDLYCKGLAAKVGRHLSGIGRTIVQKRGVLLIPLREVWEVKDIDLGSETIQIFTNRIKLNGTVGGGIFSKIHKTTRSQDRLSGRSFDDTGCSGDQTGHAQTRTLRYSPIAKDSRMRYTELQNHVQVPYASK